ncbi:MAG: hypothetical protein KDC54_08985 [Lewinella sp.]|nr:hypothetical protein [Lewinella sp.]
MFKKITQFLNRSTGAPKQQPEQQVRELLAQGDLPAALQLLIDAGYPDARRFKTQWEASEQQFAQKSINAETFNVTRNRIVYALLAMISPTGAEVPDTPVVVEEEPPVSPPVPLTADQRRQLEALLRNDEWPAALELASSWNHGFLLLSARLQQLERDRLLGLITIADYEGIRDEIKSGLEKLMGD